MASKCKGNMEANNVKKTEECARFSCLEEWSEILYGIISVLFVFKYQDAKENRVWKKYAMHNQQSPK